jgi:DNA-binding HxlR family transcriptional regulator
MAKNDDVELAKDCPTRQLLEILSEKWTPAVLYTLSEGTQRTSEIARNIPGISKKMLTQTLRNLEAWGMVKRKIYQEVPPKVEYTLTSLGMRFTEPLRLLCDWAEENRTHVRKVAERRTKT